MASRPAWVAAAMVAAAAAGWVVDGIAGGAAQAGGAGTGAAAAAGVGAGLCAAACLGVALPRLSAATRFRADPRNVVAASVAAAVVALRLFAASSPPPAALIPDGTGPWQGTVESVGRPSKGMQSVVLAFSDRALSCSARVPTYPEVPAGAIVRWTGAVEEPPASDFGRWLESRGIAAVCTPKTFEVVARPQGVGAVLDDLRQRAGDALERVLPQDEAGLAAGILIGLRDRVDPDVASSFTTSGVSHIVAISGWNIAIVAGIVAAALRRTSRRRRAVATIAAVGVYTLFVGASASVVRAAVMSGAAVTAGEIGGRLRASVALSWAIAAMLLVDPATVGDAGFQLSTAATAGLIAWSRPIGGWFERHAAWLPAALRESLAVSLAAQAATLPIVLATFGRLAPISPAVNLVAVPLVPPAMAAGTVALLAGLGTDAGAPGPLMTALALPAWLVLAVMIWIVRLAAALPGASVTFAPPWNYVAAAFAALAVSAVALRGRKRTQRRLGSTERDESLRSGGPAGQHDGAPAGRHGGAAAKRHGETQARASRSAMRLVPVLVIAMLLAGCILVTHREGTVRIVALDVGQGDAILVEGDLGSRLLVDGGPDGRQLLSELDTRIPAWSRRIDALVLTHPHDDHVGGLADLVARYDVRQVFYSGLDGSTPAFRAWRDALHGRSLTPTRIAAGQQLSLDHVSLRVLWPEPSAGPPRGPPGDADNPNRQANDTSVVLLGTFADQHFLLTGDAEDDVDPLLIAGGLPRIDVLKVAHHGSGTATSQALVDATRPRVALVSVGAGNSYGHPSRATVARLAASGARVLRTDEAGTLDAVLDGRTITLHAERPAQAGKVDSASAVIALLYDSDHDPRPNRERPPAAVPRPAALAPSPLARRGRGRRVAGPRGIGGRRPPRSRPRRGCRAPP